MTEFSPKQAVEKWLQEYGGESVEVAKLLCDRHAHIPEKVALFYENELGKKSNVTFAELRDLSSKLAGFLEEQGIDKGDRVAVMLPKSPELVIAALAIWRLGAVYLPLFTAFGPEAINYRLKDSSAKLIITDSSNRSKVEDIVKSFNVKVVTVIKEDGVLENDDYSFWKELYAAKALEQPAIVSGEDLLIILYTSGTTGNPKGVMIPVKSLASFEAYMRFGLDLREDDVYWNVADPGWAYGLYYNLIGPLLIGKATLFYSAQFKAENIYTLLESYRVTNFAAAPTAYRVMVAAGKDALRDTKNYLRVASSAGEPLNPSLIEWAKETLGIPIYDQLGQTELGMAVNNHHYPALEKAVKPGSMGEAMPGFRMTVVDKAGNELAPGQEGELAVDTHNSPLFWFKGYWQDEERTKSRFTKDGRYYLAGDAVSRDDEWYFFFTGRSDDVILSAGYRIGPFEVESALMQHPSVAETAVVGKPDPLKGEIVKAFVVLKPSYSASDELAEELSLFVKKRLSAHEYPREIKFTDALPKTPSGKTQRFLLRSMD